eukprot:SAG31_NODE_2212_length_6174_cov_11.856790_3_plen_77_part_00
MAAERSADALPAARRGGGRQRSGGGNRQAVQDRTASAYRYRYEYMYILYPGYGAGVVFGVLRSKFKFTVSGTIHIC